MKRVLILGSSGFIGGALVRKMYEQKFNISVILRDFSKAGYVSLFKDVNIKYFGLNDGSKLEKEIDKNDIIINCIHDFGNQKFNLKLLETICNAAAGTKKKVLHISTISSYQPFTNKKVINENTKLKTKTFQYAKNKNEIDFLIENYKNLNYLIIQPTIVYGKYSKPWTEKIINQLSIGKMVIPKDAGNCNLIHVDDLCDGIIHAINSNLKNEKIIISNPEKITWIQFFDFFDSLFPSERVIYEDSSKIQKNLSNPLKLLKVILGDPKKAFMWEPMKSFLMNLKNHLTPKMKNQIKEIYSFYKRFSPSPIFYPDSMLMDVYLDKSELDLDKMKNKLKFSPKINFESGKEQIFRYYEMSYKPYRNNEKISNT